MPLSVRNRSMIAVLTVAVAAPVARAEDRYWALFQDGSRVTADEFTDEDSQSFERTLGNRRLFDPDNPVRVLRNNTLSPSPPGAHVLIANGDVVPGKVLRFLPPVEELGLPARLLLSPRSALRTTDPSGLAVRADRVVRIVSEQAATGRRDPGTLVFAGGRTAKATAVRWTQDGVKALTADGIVDVRFDELVDLDVPKVDLLAAVLDDGLYPPLDGESLIGRLETVDGAVLTYRRSLTRVADETPTRPSRRRDTPRPKRLLHLQPSWALSPILVPTDVIYQRTYRAADEIPLSLLPATPVGERHGIHYWPWRRNRNVRGGPLQSGQLAVGLGVGTHSHSEIAFELPPGATQFTAMVGLDDVVGDGGCARAKVFRDRVAGTPLFDSGLLRGHDDPARVGPLNVANAKRLVLVNEFAHQDRPPGADPFDIRDHVDWLLPMITVGGVEADRAGLVRRFVPGWQMWTLEDAAADRIDLSAEWDEALSVWVPVVGLSGSEGLTLSRTLSEVSRANDLLELNVSPANAAAVRQIELRVDGTRIEPVTQEAVVDQRVRERYRRNRIPVDDGAIIRWDLQAYRGREIQLELEIPPGPRDSARLAWRGCALKSAIRNLPPDGQSFAPDLPLTSLEPVDLRSPKLSAYPMRNGLPRFRGKTWPIRFLGQPYENGYSMIRDSSISFAVEPSYKQFVAVVGCCADEAGPFSVRLDGEVVWTAGPMNASMQAVQVSIKIPPGTKKLTLETGNQGSYSGYGAWANAGFLTQ